MDVETAGLVNSEEFHRTKGMTEDLANYGITKDSTRNDRALCCQSPQQLEQLARDFPTLGASFRVPAAFGQNLTVDGLDCCSLCVGDVFVVEDTRGQRRSLLLEVSSPRRPCCEVDQNHGKIYKQSGVRAHCARTGLAGWFFRVKSPGQIALGDTLRLAARPRPEWSLARISHLIYDEHSNSKYDVPRFSGTEEELRMLATGLPELSLYEYGTIARDLLTKRLQGSLPLKGEIAYEASGQVSVGIAGCTVVTLVAVALAVAFARR